MRRPRRILEQRGAVDWRLLLVGGAVLAVGALFLLVRGDRPTTRRPRAPAATRAPTTPAPAEASARDAATLVADVMDATDAAPAMRYDGLVALGVRPAIPGMVGCFRQAAVALRRNTYVWFTIDSAGRVTASRLGVDAGAAVNACVLASLQTLTFPSPGRESREFGIPLPAR